MKLLLWLRELAGRIGIAGVAGLLSLAAAALLQLTLNQQAARQRDALEVQVAALRETLRVSGPRDTTGDTSNAAQLARFYASFPSAQTTAEWLSRIQAAALHNGIVLQAGEYRMETRVGERLRRYAIVLPIRGSYTQIRGFVDAVLAEVPSIALDDIDLRRELASSATLEARVRLTLYLRGAP